MAEILEQELDNSYYARVLSAFKSYCVVLKHMNSIFDLYIVTIR